MSREDSKALGLADANPEHRVDPRFGADAVDPLVPPEGPDAHKSNLSGMSKRL